MIMRRERPSGGPQRVGSPLIPRNTAAPPSDYVSIRDAHNNESIK